MSIRVAIGAGLLIGAAILAVAFEVADRFELNLFHIGDT